ISVKPFPDGSRGAIWRYRPGDYAGGVFSARELEIGLKNFNFAALKPMGGGVPAPTHPFPEPPITDYQAKVMQLAREGKIPPQSDQQAKAIWRWTIGCVVFAGIALFAWRRRS